MDIATLSTKVAQLMERYSNPSQARCTSRPNVTPIIKPWGLQEAEVIQDGVAMPDRAAYFTSRGSVMGQVSGQVVTATFAVFNPAVVIPAVEQGWTLTDAATICDARDRGAIAQLERILGTSPTGIERANEILLRAYYTAAR
jgi:hypothetical protein